MNSNRAKLAEMFTAKNIQLTRCPIFDIALAAKPPEFDFGRVEGMLLGLAIGDALGNTTESMLPSHRKAQHGEIRDYIPNAYAPKGVPSDDTQLAFWTLEQMIEDRGFVPEHVAARFCRGTIYGIGSAVREFLANYKYGKSWDKCGPPRNFAERDLHTHAPRAQSRRNDCEGRQRHEGQ